MSASLRRRVQIRWLQRDGDVGSLDVPQQQQWEEEEKGQEEREDGNTAAVTNVVRTSHYTPLTFLPINLFEQFSVLANFYFLCVGVVQLIPQVSTTSGVPTMYMPLVFVLAVSALKGNYRYKLSPRDGNYVTWYLMVRCVAGLEDYRRHQHDKALNERLYQVWDGHRCHSKQAGELQVST